MTLKQRACENIVGKGENAGNQHFLLSHNVFSPIRDRNRHFSNIEFVVCKCFQFGKGQNFVFGKELTFSQMTIFRLFQTGSVCR